MSVKRGIYLVANKRSENLCENLIFSIRQLGCTLPIKVIHFGGEPVEAPYILDNATLVQSTDFPPEAVAFIDEMQVVINNCPRGFLYRFLPWFGEWEEFIYTDNDVVATCNWEIFLDHLGDHDLVNADEEYTTNGKYNFFQAKRIDEIFGVDALQKAVTAGHFGARRKLKHIGDFKKALEWFGQNTEIPKKHDQALLHMAILLGDWNNLNLCKLPHNWLSSWAGDHKNSLELISQIQKGRSISHIHYSGRSPDGTWPIDDLIFSHIDNNTRLKKIVAVGLEEMFGITYLKRKKKNALHKLNKFLQK